MTFLPICSRILFCLSLWLTGTFFSARSLSITDLKIEEQDVNDTSSEFTMKEFWDKNQVLLSENTLVLSFMTETD